MDFEFEPEEKKTPSGRGGPRHPHKIRRSDDIPDNEPVPVDSADFFQPVHQDPPAPPARPAPAAAGPSLPARGFSMLILLLQAALSAAALFQLYRTRMLPVYYLAILGALLVLLWLLVFKCQRY